MKKILVLTIFTSFCGSGEETKKLNGTASIKIEGLSGIIALNAAPELIWKVGSETSTEYLSTYLPVSSYKTVNYEEGKTPSISVTANFRNGYNVIKDSVNRVLYLGELGKITCGSVSCY